MKITSVQRLSVLIAGGLAITAIGSANAANVAQFTEQAQDAGGLFSYTTSGNSASIAAKDLPVILDFSSQTPNSAPSQYIDALLNLSGTSSSAATEIAPGVFDESFNSLDLTFTSEANPSTVIFSAQSSSTTLDLNPGLFASGPTTSIIASNTGTGTASLASPYIDPSLISADQGISLSLTNVNPNISQCPTGYLNNFTADVTGTFSGSSSLVPEPSPALVFGIAAAGLTGLVMVRRRKTAKSAE